jgi:hypothetical protein
MMNRSQSVSWSERWPIGIPARPHPVPLPQGEGAALQPAKTPQAQLTRTSGRKSETKHTACGVSTRSNIPPLPGGEGRGEGGRRIVRTPHLRVPVRRGVLSGGLAARLTIGDKHALGGTVAGASRRRPRFLPRLARHERGEGRGEGGVRGVTALLSPTLSSHRGRRGSPPPGHRGTVLRHPPRALWFPNGLPSRGSTSYVPVSS